MKNKKIISILIVASVLIAAGAIIAIKGFSVNDENKISVSDNSSISVEESSSISNNGESSAAETKEDVKDKDTSIDDTSKNEDKIETTTSETNSNNTTATTTTQSTADLEAQYKKINKSDWPSIIVFSYDAECCETTKKFFNVYNSKAKQIIKDYQNEFETLFINTGILGEEDMKTANIIAFENKVKQLPSILLRKPYGKTFKVVVGDFDDKELRTIMDGMVKK